ncbi:type II CAAX prenyl endopeptidase Rce1 family protein [Prosthecobacter sp.]|uniref:CPBP family glutamic-type intramembrane protease n=1 Tax=Prosthecobacter sp. TaxID=1965333 RepID=UPI003782FAFF
MQAASPGSSPALPKLLLYLLAVMLGGALLSAPLFHLGKAAHGWLSASSWHEAGMVKWLLSEIERAQFTRYFNRAVLVCALLFIWPFMRWVRLERSLLPAWQPLGTGLREWATGFFLASGLLLVLGFIFLQLGAYQLRPDARWLKLGEPITAALGAGIVEEFFFRGLLLGLLLRTMAESKALVSLTFVFALVHFLKPPEGWQISDADVTWSSGFLVLKQIAAGFGDVHFLLAEFATLFAVGWVLAKMRMQTGALWAGIGLHGGWVFGLKYFSALTLYTGSWLPWIGANLKVGLAPLFTVLLTGWIASRLVRSR